MEPLKPKALFLPIPVGQYCIGDYQGKFCISLYKKPNAFHRFMMNLCLGFKWTDND